MKGKTTAQKKPALTWGAIDEKQDKGRKLDGNYFLKTRLTQ